MFCNQHLHPSPDENLMTPIGIQQPCLPSRCHDENITFKTVVSQDLLGEHKCIHVPSLSQ
jgi:hypothetical protein